MKYLGVIIDTKLTYLPHIKQAADKAAKMVAALSRLMRNVSGPRASKRRLLMDVAQSIMLYGAGVWAEAMAVDKYRKRLASVQRNAALRVACAYRSVSEKAVLVVAGMMLIDLLARERAEVFEERTSENGSSTRVRAREHTLVQWHERWDEDTAVAQWIHTFILELSPWLRRTHGEVSFQLCQFLTGHGHFNRYLFRRGIKVNPFCDYYPDLIEDAEHTLFHCERWMKYRRALEVEIGKCITPATVIYIMLDSKDDWDAIAHYISTVLKMRKMREAI